MIGNVVLWTGCFALAAGVACEAGRSLTAGVGRTRGLPGGTDHPAPPWFAAVLDGIDLDVAPDRVWPWCAASGIAGIGLVAVRAPAVALLVLGGVVAIGRVGRRVRRRRPSGDRELIAAVDALAAALRSGASLPQAVERAADAPGVVAEGLRVALARSGAGMPLDDALAGWATDCPAAGAASVADALAVARLVGAGPVRALDAVGRTLRERQARAREIRALASQARASAAVLVCAPVGFAAAVALADRRVAHVLVATPVGWACLAGGVVLDAAGAWWMATLVRRVS